MVWAVGITLQKVKLETSQLVTITGELIADITARASYTADGLHSGTIDLSDYDEDRRTIPAGWRVQVRLFYNPDTNFEYWYREMTFCTEPFTEEVFLDDAIWTFYYYLRFRLLKKYFRFNCPDYNSRIENFSYTPTAPPPADKPLISPPHITEPQVARPLIRLLRK